MLYRSNPSRRRKNAHNYIQAIRLRSKDADIRACLKYIFSLCGRAQWEFIKECCDEYFDNNKVGISVHKSSSRYQARVREGSRYVYLGYYESEKDAKEAICKYKRDKGLGKE